jgi:hypothetical protein
LLFFWTLHRIASKHCVDGDDAFAGLHTRATLLAALCPIFPVTPLAIDRARENFAEALLLLFLGALASTEHCNYFFETGSSLDTLAARLRAGAPSSPWRNDAVDGAAVRVAVVELLECRGARNAPKRRLRFDVSSNQDFTSSTSMTAHAIHFPFGHDAIHRAGLIIARQVLLHVTGAL